MGIFARVSWQDDDIGEAERQHSAEHVGRMMSGGRVTSSVDSGGRAMSSVESFGRGMTLSMKPGGREIMTSSKHRGEEKIMSAKPGGRALWRTLPCQPQEGDLLWGNVAL